MRTHLSDTEIKAYRSRTASPEQLLAVSDHILECVECQRRLESPERLRASYDEISEDLKTTLSYGREHLDYGQLAGYVDGTLDAKSREPVSAHIDHCVECTSELQEIATLKSLIEKEADSQPRPVRRDRLATFLRTPRYRLAFALAVIVVLFAFISWFQLRRMHLRIIELEAATARLEEENNYLRRQSEEMRAKGRGNPSLTLKDGDRNITINEKGDLLGFDGLPASYHDALKDALTTGRVPIPPSPETTVGKAGSLLGTSPQEKTFAVLSPAGTVVEDTRPVFEWQRLAGAISYTVLVKDLATGAEIESQPISGTNWRSHKQLVRGHQYTWMVEAIVDGRGVRAPAADKPFATFKILDAKEAEEIGLARKAWGSSHLVMGVIYTKAGLRHEAEKEFRELVVANPESSMARSLLTNVEIKAPGGHRQ